MEEFVLEFVVPDFTQRNCAINVEAVHRACEGNDEDLSWCASIHPNGNEGFVSITFDTLRYLETPFQCVVSIADIDGESRFAQSFQFDSEKRTEQDAGSLYYPFKIERFIRRSLLLDSPEELLPGGTLTLRCNVVTFEERFKYLEDEEDELRRLHAMAENESWFVLDDEKSDYRLLDLRNPDSPLCNKLRKKSEYFEALFRWPCSKEMQDGHFPVHRSEFDAFFDMLYYVRFEDLQYIRGFKKYWRLYEMAARYGVLDLQEKCSAYLKQNISSYVAVDVLRIADLYYDSELRAVAFRCVLSNWKDDELKWQVFDELDPDLRNQLVCAAQILNLEDEARDRLCCLAAREVHLNRKIVQNSITWPNFAKKLPELTKVILSLDAGEYSLDLDDGRSREDYEDQPIHSDLYRRGHLVGGREEMREINSFYSQMPINNCCWK